MQGQSLRIKIHRFHQHRQIGHQSNVLVGNGDGQKIAMHLRYHRYKVARQRVRVLVAVVCMGIAMHGCWMCPLMTKTKSLFGVHWAALVSLFNLDPQIDFTLF